MSNARVIAFYLPQFYPFKENDEWWGKGFTEWTNVGKAKPLYRNHYQPKVPADLGYYDLRLPEIRQAQADLAKTHGVAGFCYWHYWFGGGRRLLDRVFDEVVKSKKPDFPFCLGWANETWSGVWHGLENKILIEQTYPGDKDIIDHFNAMLEGFKDSRYIKVDGKLLFLIYKPFKVPNFRNMKEIWNKLAIENGLDGFFFVAHSHVTSEIRELMDLGYDGVNIVRLSHVAESRSKLVKGFRKYIRRVPHQVYDYKFATRFFSGEEEGKIENCFPSIFPNWDHSPRSNTRALILNDSRPEYFKEHVKEVIQKVAHKPDDKRIIFLKSWNEWGEGNYMEPDLKYGLRYLEVLKEELEKINDDGA